MRFRVAFKGVHIGPTCVTGEAYGTTWVNGIEYDVAAHAHTTGCPPVGWVCAKTKKDLAVEILHELAHLAADTGHDDRWRKSVHRLGGRVPAAYKKRPR